MPAVKFKQTSYDVIIIGAGHNGLTSAAYLAKAGLSVLLLERRQHVGGAAISEQVFPGVNARLSAYAYLLSLFPTRIMQDLKLNIETRRRSVASFTPVLTANAGQSRGLLVNNSRDSETAESFRQFTGNDSEYKAFKRFYQLAALIAKQVWPTLTKPLIARADLKRRFDTAEARQAWEMVFEQPLGMAIEQIFDDDTVRGLVFTDAKIGVLTHPHDPTLLQNRTFLYHVVGNETGEWRVPAGGMGVVTAELERAARAAGAEIITGAMVDVLHVSDNGNHEVQFSIENQDYQLDARYILVNATPAELKRLVNGHRQIDDADRPNGSVFKINMLLKRLPRLKANYSAEQAFTGTFHLDEGYAAMQRSYQAAAAGQIPENIPGEMYCHSLTDGSILDPSLHGYQTLTLFGLDTPYSLFTANHDRVKQDILARYLRAINRYLLEPLEACFAVDSHGQPCLDAKSPLDLERELNMHGGNIFHTDLSWPFAMTETEIGTWGVETRYRNVFLCGSGAARGGCVSGIPGHNAAMKVLTLSQDGGRIHPL